VTSLLIVAVILSPDRGEAGTAITFQTGPGEVYELQCASCHGGSGEGTAFGTPLTDSSLSLDERIEIITNGSGEMPAFRQTLSDETIGALAELMDALEVADIYRQQCAPCHGAGGAGGVGPSLQTSTMTDAELLQIIRDGSSTMPAFGPTLTDTEIDALVAYSALLRDATPTPGDAGAGAAVYEAQCAGCHGADGEGAAAPSLQASALIDTDVLAIIRDGEGGMPAYATILAESELQAVAAFAFALQEPSPPPQETPIQRGARVYADNCANCHGPDAAGEAGPTLRTASATGESMAQIINEGLGSMPGYSGRLEPSDISAVIVFLRELAQAAEPPPTDGPDDDITPVARGATLFTQNCSSCHGPDAGGGAGPALKNTRLSEAEILIVILNGRGAMPRFSTILSNEDAGALVAYLSAARETDAGPGALPSTATVGEEIFRATCATCHGPDGGGGIGPRLAGTRLSTNELISQVFGGHPEGMPAFEGVLDPVQVQEVARHILALEAEPRSDPNWIVWVVIVGLMAVAAYAIWYYGIVGRLMSQVRRLSRRLNR
jgi:mono/diheme cytochrome c family protein